jgi:beta-lactamase regulating signal transducer with metallopeptidase domain
MDVVVAAWWSWMLSMLWQVGVLVAVLAVVDRLVRSWAWPPVRYALWLLVVVKLVMPPWWALPGGGVPAVLARVGATVERSWSGDDAAPPAAREADGTAVGTAGAPDPTESGGMTIFWPTVAFVVWILGMLVVAVVIAARTVRLARWHREQVDRPAIPEWFHELLMATSKRLGLERVPAVVFSEEAVTPAVYGLLTPTLLLPAHATDTLSREEAEHVLLHEMAHLKRGDLVVHAVLLVLRVVYWFNPFVAYAHRQLKHLREICCDLTVAGFLREKTRAYRQTLVDTARRILTERLEPGMGLLGVFEEPYKVVARLRWLEEPTWERRRLMTATAAFIAILVAPLLLPMAVDGASIGQVGWAGNAAGETTSTETFSSAVSPAADGPHAYVRSVYRVEQLILGFVVRSRQAAVSEIWVGRDTISVSERNRTVILDRRRQTLTIVDHPSETWVRTTLPLEIDAVLGEEPQRARREIRTTGEVEATSRSRTILGRRCPEFRLRSWSTRGSSRTDPSSFSVWTTTEVPFDLSLLDEVLVNLRLLYNRDAGYRRELEKMPGLQMRLQAVAGTLLGSSRWVDEVVELERRLPPPGTYGPPWGYRRVDRFEHLDL